MAVLSDAWMRWDAVRSEFDPITPLVGLPVGDFRLSGVAEQAGHEAG